MEFYSRHIRKTLSIILNQQLLLDEISEIIFWDMIAEYFTHK